MKWREHMWKRTKKRSGLPSLLCKLGKHQMITGAIDTAGARSPKSIVVA